MNYIFFLAVCLLGVSVYGDGISSEVTPVFDENLGCFVDEEGFCDFDYVDELFELCKDCEIETPEKSHVSPVEAWFRSLGIKLAYKIIESPLELTAYGVALVGCGFLLYRSVP